MKNHPVLIAILVAALGLVPGVGFAKELPQTPLPKNVKFDENSVVEHGYYSNARGELVHSPAHSKSSAVPVGASAHCRDGSYSFSRNHRGTCSRHGGVAQWLN